MSWDVVSTWSGLDGGPGPWIPITDFGTDWVAAPGWDVPAYRLLGNGDVEYRGALINTNGTGPGSVAFTVDPPARPSPFVQVPITEMDPSPLGFNAAALFIDVNGEATYLGLIGDNNMRIHIDGVIYSLG